MEITPRIRARADRRNNAARAQLLQRIRAEFEAMPSLHLTCAQTRRLFGLRGDICERVLATLVDEGTLTRGADDRYALCEELAERARLSRALGQHRTGSMTA